MYGAMIGELAAFSRGFGQVDMMDAEVPLLPEPGGDGRAVEGRDFSCVCVLAAAVEDGLLRFEKRLPELFSGAAGRASAGAAGRASAADFEGAFKEELSEALRKFGRAHPFAGYPMDLSIWLFRDGAPSAEQDAGPAARAFAVPWMFQDDLYMMRHLTALQARLTHGGKEAAGAAEPPLLRTIR